MCLTSVLKFFHFVQFSFTSPNFYHFVQFSFTSFNLFHFFQYSFTLSNLRSCDPISPVWHISNSACCLPCIELLLTFEWIDFFNPLSSVDVLPPVKKWKSIFSKQGNISAKMRAFGICTEHVFIVIAVASCSSCNVFVDHACNSIEETLVGFYPRLPLVAGDGRVKYYNRNTRIWMLGFDHW